MQHQTVCPLCGEMNRDVPGGYVRCCHCGACYHAGGPGAMADSGAMRVELRLTPRGLLCFAVACLVLLTSFAVSSLFEEFGLLACAVPFLFWGFRESRAAVCGACGNIVEPHAKECPTCGGCLAGSAGAPWGQPVRH